MSGNPPSLLDDDVSSGSGEDTTNMLLDGQNNNNNNNNNRPSATPTSTNNRKRGRKATGDAIVDAMLEIAAASKMRAAALTRNDERFAISKCIKLLDEIQGIDQNLYFFALDLFETCNSREIFMSLKNDRRVPWLSRKFRAFEESKK